MDETTATEYEIPGVTELIPEDPTEVTEPNYEEIIVTIQQVGSDIVHVDLFGSFLVCGTLVGLVLWRRVHGT